VYVKHDATGANNGTSWVNAYTDLQMAIDSTSGQDIWVAAGTYYPQSDTSGNYFPLNFREKSFHPRLAGGGNLKLYGGFIGNESLLTQRNPNTNITILSGDLGVVNSNADNAYHIITIHNNSGISKIIDGFEISKGNADGLGINQDRGGAIYMTNTNVKINSCKIHDNNSNNKGGAIYLEYSFVYINSAKCYNNQSDNGGAICSSYSSTNSTLSEFYNNQANIKGGAIFMENDLIINLDIYSSIIVQNSFDGNLALNSGGAIFIKDKNASTHWNSNVFKNNLCEQGSFFTIINSQLFNFYLNTVVDNGLISSVAFYAQNSSGNIGRSIFWNKGNNEFELIGSPNLKVDNSLLKGNIVPETNGTKLLKNIDPKFVNYPSDLHLKITSPAINVGGTFFTVFLSNDFDNTIRKKGNFFDLGAYEFDPINCPNTTRVYIDKNATGSDNGTNWAGAFNDIDEGFYQTNACPNITEVWMAAGIYIPESTFSRDYNIRVEKSLSVFGGFQGFETTLNDRVLSPMYETIISGDVGVLSDSSDNIKQLFLLDEINMKVLMDGLSFEDAMNTDLFGGAVSMIRGKITLRNCVFRRNQALYGGALYLGSIGRSAIFNSNFNNNNALQYGGGILSYCDSLDILESHFKSNFSGSLGGAMFIGGTALLLDSIYLDNNFAESSGGGIYSHNGKGTFTRINSKGNKSSFGGSIYLASATLAINASTFCEDSSLIGGAMYFFSSNVNLDNIKASRNKAFNGTVLATINASAVLNNCFFNENMGQDSSSAGTLIDLSHSSLHGNNLEVFDNLHLTAISTNASKFTLSNSNMYHNQQLGTFGHKLFNLLNTVLRFENVFITDNHFNTNFYVSGYSSTDTFTLVNTHVLRNEGTILDITGVEDFKVVNSVIANNIAPTFTTLATFTLGTKGSILNSVITGNQDPIANDLMQIYDSELSIGNCIITDNSNSGILNSNSTVNAYNSIITNGTSLGPNILDVDPMFVDPASDNFNLQMGSPAINTGSPLNAPATDILGNPRPQGGFYDMGIYEYAIPTNFVFNGTLDNDWHKGGNWDTGFPPPNVFNGNIIFNASATKIDGLGFDINNPGTLTLGNGVIVEIK